MISPKFWLESVLTAGRHESTLQGSGRSRNTEESGGTVHTYI